MVAANVSLPAVPAPPTGAGVHGLRGAWSCSSASDSSAEEEEEEEGAAAAAVKADGLSKPYCVCWRAVLIFAVAPPPPRASASTRRLFCGESASQLCWAVAPTVLATLSGQDGESFFVVLPPKSVEIHEDGATAELTVAGKVVDAVTEPSCAGPTESTVCGKTAQRMAIKAALVLAEKDIHFFLFLPSSFLFSFPSSSPF